jgi:hypothetical protein
MAKIGVNIWDQNGDRKGEVTVEEDLQVSSFIRELIIAFGLPETDESNLRLTYRLGRLETRQILNEAQTLKEAGVTEGNDLMLLPEPTAGRKN